MPAKLLQLCLTLHDPVDCSHGILQARILEWVAISSSRGSPLPRDWTVSLTFPALADGFFFSTNTTWEAPETLRFTQIKLGEQAEVKITVFTMTGLVLLLLLSHFSRVRLLVTPWTAAYQAPPSMGFSRQEYWSGVQLPSPGFILPKDKYIVICSWNSYSLLRSSKLKEQTNSNAVSNPLHLRNYLSVLKPNSSSHTEPTLNILFDNYKSFLWKPLLWLPESVLLKTLD